MEGLLKTVHRPAAAARTDGASTEGSSPSTFGGESSRPPERPQGPSSEQARPWKPFSPNASSSGGDDARFGELFGLGRFESLPPFEMIEDLYVPNDDTSDHEYPLLILDANP